MSMESEPRAAAHEEGPRDGTRNDLSETVRTSPYVAAGAALAVGFVLGGGLTPSLLRRGLGLGARAAVVALARDAISGPAESAPDLP